MHYANIKTALKQLKLFNYHKGKKDKNTNLELQVCISQQRVANVYTSCNLAFV